MDAPQAASYSSNNAKIMVNSPASFVKELSATEYIR
jgi:hypothetical protein